MIEIKRKVKKEVEEIVKVDLKFSWCVRILRPNGNRTYYATYEQEFDYEPSNDEIAQILVEHRTQRNEFASVVKNYRLIEVE